MHLYNTCVIQFYELSNVDSGIAEYSYMQSMAPGTRYHEYCLNFYYYKFDSKRSKKGIQKFRV